MQSHQSRAAIPTKSGRVNDTKLNGRGERSFDANKDQAVLAAKAQEFAQMVQRFQADPLAEPQSA